MSDSQFAGLMFILVLGLGILIVGVAVIVSHLNYIAQTLATQTIETRSVQRAVTNLTSQLDPVIRVAEKDLKENR